MARAVFRVSPGLCKDPTILDIENVATTYGVAMSLAPLLQARKMWRQRSSRDVSILYLTVLLVGFSLYLAYGFSISNRLLIVTNSVSIAATAVTLVIAVSLSHRRSGVVAERDDLGRRGS